MLTGFARAAEPDSSANHVAATIDSAKGVRGVSTQMPGYWERLEVVAVGWALLGGLGLIVNGMRRQRDMQDGYGITK